MVVYHVDTGTRFERWPVDAMGMLGTGAYTTDVPEGAECETPAVAVAPDPVPHVTKAVRDTTTLSPTGAPLVIAPADGVSVAQPFVLPGAKAKGKRER